MRLLDALDGRLGSLLEANDRPGLLDRSEGALWLVGLVPNAELASLFS